MRFGWLAAAAAMVFAVPASAATYVRYEVSGAGRRDVQTPNADTVQTYGELFIDFSILVDTAVINTANSNEIGSGSFYSRSAFPDFVTASGGAGTLTYNENNNFAGTQTNISINYDGNSAGFPLALNSNVASGSFSSGTSGKLITSYGYIGTAQRFAILGFSDSFKNAVTSFVPEPETWLCFIMGFGVLGWAVRAQRRKVAMLAS